MTSRKSLRGAVCVVTGGASTAGRGIVAELGDAGAIVYITGRNVDALDEAAAALLDAGADCRVAPCDHTADEQVAAVFDRVRAEQGRVDVLINNAWGGYEQRAEDAPFFGSPFWEQPLWRWDGMFTAGVRAGFVSSRFAAPLMLGHTGLIVNTVAWAYGGYLGNVLYDTAKAATARMAFGMAEELRPYGVSAVALALGHLGVSESPHYGGRAVVALATDDELIKKSGTILTPGDLAREYGFTDLDGSQPEPFAVERRPDASCAARV